MAWQSAVISSPGALCFKGSRTPASITYWVPNLVVLAIITQVGTPLLNAVVDVQLPPKMTTLQFLYLQAGQLFC
nr:hypothetical protein Iba_chr12bCG7560 [Ipomoea batatas]GMD65370.1 hypothetical protein Iba_chr12cCG4740 [Ipomoea batatas]